MCDVSQTKEAFGAPLWGASLGRSSKEAWFESTRGSRAADKQALLIAGIDTMQPRGVSRPGVGREPTLMSQKWTFKEAQNVHFPRCAA